jgi:outer membrane biosynthesis protein TonB
MRFVKIDLSDLDNLGWQLFAEKRCYLISGGMREGDLIMKKLTGAILAAFVFAVGSQGLVSAAAPMDLDLNGPALVMLDDAADEEEEASAEPAQAEEENNEEEPAAEQEQPANDANDDDEA